MERRKIKAVITRWLMDVRAIRRKITVLFTLANPQRLLVNGFVFIDISPVLFSDTFMSILISRVLSHDATNVASL